MNWRNCNVFSHIFIRKVHLFTLKVTYLGFHYLHYDHLQVPLRARKFFVCIFFVIHPYIYSSRIQLILAFTHKVTYLGCHCEHLKTTWKCHEVSENGPNSFNIHSFNHLSSDLFRLSLRAPRASASATKSLAAVLIHSFNHLLNDLFRLSLRAPRSLASVTESLAAVHSSLAGSNWLPSGL